MQFPLHSLSHEKNVLICNQLRIEQFFTLPEGEDYINVLLAPYQCPADFKERESKGVIFNKSPKPEWEMLT